MKTGLQRDIWREERALKSRIVTYWDKRADSFRKQRDTDMKNGQYQVWEEELERRLPRETGLRILDVGCGCGFFSLILAGRGHRVTGIDLTANMVEQGRHLAEKYGIPVDLRQMDAEHLAFPAESFDAVISRNLTWTLPHPDEAYRQWLRVLKKGGILLNYDAEYARYHQAHGLDGEKAHGMLSAGQKAECLDIYRMLEVSRWKRPQWDVRFLRQNGCGEVEVDLQAGRRLFPGENQNQEDCPVFCIRAVKGSRDRQGE